MGHSIHRFIHSIPSSDVNCTDTAQSSNAIVAKASNILNNWKVYTAASGVQNSSSVQSSSYVIS